MCSFAVMGLTYGLSPLFLILALWPLRPILVVLSKKIIFRGLVEIFVIMRL